MSVERILGPSDRKLSGLSEKEALKETVEELVVAVRTLINVFEKAKEDIKAEPTQQVLLKLNEQAVHNTQVIELNREMIQQMGRVLQQNKEMARALVMLLDLHREHLPVISRNSRLSSEVRRAPPEGYPGASFARRHSRTAPPNRPGMPPM